MVPAYPLPRIQQAPAALRRKALFSVFDFPRAYCQIQVQKAKPGLKGSRKFLVRTPDGQYGWIRMPSGAAAAPATQQRMISILLGGMKWVCAAAYSDGFSCLLLHSGALGS